MMYTKGFSLIEVLISLAITATLIVGLIEQQMSTLTLFKQLMLREGGSEILDQIDELSLFSNPTTLDIPEPFQFVLYKKTNHERLELTWANRLGLIQRDYDDL